MRGHSYLILHKSASAMREELRGLLLWSLDGSNGVGTLAGYINAHLRTNTSLVSERVRMGSEHLSPVFTKWLSAVMCLQGG